MPKWQVQLIGSEKNLGLLIEVGNQDAWGISQNERGVYLESTSFENLGNTGEVRSLAEDLLGRINRGAKLLWPSFDAVTINAIVTLNPNGTREHALGMHVKAKGVPTVALGETVALGVGMDAIIVGPDAVDNSGACPDIASLVEIQGRKEQVNKALGILLADMGWEGLYKAFEAAKGGVGGKSGLHKQRWVTRRDINRFTQSAQLERHFEASGPGDPMSLPEAQEFIWELVRKWTDWELSKANNTKK